MGKLLVLCFCSVLFGCAPVVVRTNIDKRANFSSFKTFSWMDGGVFTYSGPVQFSDSLLMKSLEEVIAAELEAKGFKLDKENPDLLVGVTITLKGSTSRWFIHSQRRPVKSRDDIIYELSGTLVLAIADTKESKMVWEGYAIKFLEAGEELSRRRLHRGVKALLEKYPKRKA